LIEKVADIKIGNPIGDPSIECGPLISERAAKELEKQLEDSLAQGAEILYGGKRLEGAFFQPTVMTVTKDTDVAHDLGFRAGVSIIGFDTVDEAIEIAKIVYTACAAELWARI
jgi:succinate-semialdehyde dehydrogenase/glutarate-semialdehyde dehydrogenase